MLCLPLCAQAGIYRCQKDGKPVFSDKPCEVQQQRSTGRIDQSPGIAIGSRNGAVNTPSSTGLPAFSLPPAGATALPTLPADSPARLQLIQKINALGIQADKSLESGQRCEKELQIRSPPYQCQSLLTGLAKEMPFDRAMNELNRSFAASPMELQSGADVQINLLMQQISLKVSELSRYKAMALTAQEEFDATASP